MPARPPVFRPAGWKPRKAWVQRAAAGQTERIRGRRGQQLRAEVLTEEPLCRVCLAQGRTVRSEVVDHITPLAWGGLEERANRQALCHACHDEKSAMERASSGRGAALFPSWLKPSSVPLTIVCGPPASGKSTYVDEHRMAGDLVICLDTIRAKLQPGWKAWSGAYDGELFARAVRYRNHLLGTLARPVAGREAWFIVSAPEEGQRQWWQERLGGELVLLDPGADECKRRAIERGTPLAVRGIDDWYRRAQEPWSAKQ